MASVGLPVLAHGLDEDRAADLANIRADRAHVRAYREVRRYREDPAYRVALEQFDAVLARRERELEVRA